MTVHDKDLTGEIRRVHGTRFMAATRAQLALIDTWMSAYGETMAGSFLDSQGRRKWVVRYLTGDLSAEQQMVTEEITRLDRASTWWVSPEMIVTVTALTEGLPDAPFHPTDLITPSGFAYLDHPVRFLDVNQETVNVQAFLWYPTVMNLETSGQRFRVHGLTISTYSSSRDPSDSTFADLTEQQRRVLPPLVLLNHMALPWCEPGADVPDSEPDDRIRVPVLTSPGGPSEQPVFPPDPRMRLSPDIGDPSVRWLTALWRVAAQRITVSQVMFPDRAESRRLARRGKPVEWGQVRVVDLRRVLRPRSDRDNPGFEQRWSHRWLVRPHWRRQWYPNESRHRWVLIPGHTKGPEHLPLIVKDPTFRVRR